MAGENVFDQRFGMIDEQTVLVMHLTDLRKTVLQQFCAVFQTEFFVEVVR